MIENGRERIMMKIFICPSCGQMTSASRKKELFCVKCDKLPMELTKLSLVRFMEMDEQQRGDYAESWLYIHGTGKDSEE